MNPGGWQPLPVPPAPPAYYAPPPVPPSKPSTVYKALGIVQAVLGAVGVVYALFSLLMAGVFGATGAAKLWDEWMIAFTVAQGASSVLTGALLIATGIGVFRAKRWSRPVGIAYAVLSLLSTIGGTLVSVLVVQPHMYSKMGFSAPSGMQTFSIVTAALGALMYSVLPVLTLVFLLRRAARDELDA